MKRLLLSIMVSGIFAGAMAIPAKPGFIEYEQPDGTVIKIQLVGDENGHMIYSENGFLLVDNDGQLEYAKFNVDGYPIPSGVKATPDSDRQMKSMNFQSQLNIENWTKKMISVRNERLEKLQTAKSLRRVATRAEESEDDGDDSRIVPMNFGRCESTFPVLGKQKGLVILVEYQDVTFDYGNFDYFNRMLNEVGFSDYGSLGSARDWFIENSNGRFLPDFDVFGPVMLPNKREYYGGNDYYGNDLHPEEMVIDACELLDDQIDFSQYDRDGDGIIDNVFLFYAGKGEHDSQIKNAVWPHSWDVTAVYPDEEFIYDGVKLNHYACTCEYPSGYKRPDGIGTFVHEFSHVIGLPDLYNTSYTTDYTPCEWSVMDQGPYNNDRLTPPNYSSYEKVALGWLDFKPLSEGVFELNDLSSSNEAYAMPTDKEDEFFFFENRQQRGNDKYLPGHGMLIWHVDYKKLVWATNTVNNTPNHQYVDLVEADNLRTKTTRAGDSFPGTKNVTSFGYGTKPQLVSWSKKRLAYDLEDINESADGIISFTVVDSETNAVESVEVDNGSDDVYYDLTGRRVANPGKGIYIHNGKKIIIK